jgi:hypothetical protein
MNDIQKLERDFIRVVGGITLTALRAELEEQGFKNTGKLIKSLRYESESDNLSTVIRFFFQEYGKFVDEGVPASSYKFGGGNKPKSKAVEELIKWAVEKLGIGTQKALGVAIAIIKTYKKQGYVTNNSLKFSKNGHRRNFIKRALKRINNNVRTRIIALIGATFGYLFQDAIKQLSL